jgi:hypothetical protein
VASYSFRLDTMHVNFQRGKIPDHDLVTFIVQVGLQTYGPIAGFIPQRLNSGDTINFNEFSPTLPAGRKVWETDAIEVNDGDVVSVGYTVVNLSETPLPAGDFDQSDTIKIEAATTAGILAITGGAIATSGVLAVPGAIIAGVGAAIEVAGEIIADIMGHDPHCNGLVLGDKLNVSSSELSDLVGGVGLGHSKSLSFQYPNADSPAECGHPPDTVLTWSILDQTVPIFKNSPPPPNLPPRPLLGTHPGDWAGTWSEKGIFEDGLINVQLLVIPGSGKNKPLEVKASAKTLVPQIGADPRTFFPRINIAPLPAIQQAAINRLILVDHQKAFVTERRHPETGEILTKIDGLDCWDVPMIAPPRSNDIFAPSANLSTDPGLLSPTSPEIGIIVAPVFTEPGAVTLNLPTATESLAVSFADSLFLGNGITLQMYGDFDERHRVVRRHIRYLRTQPDGSVVVDVMLGIAQRRPT